MGPHTAALVDVQLAAVAHPIRRAILQRVLTREVAAGDLADEFDVSRPAVSQHIRVLVDARLLVERRERQRRMYRANLEALRSFQAQFDGFWASGLARLKETVETRAKQRKAAT
jgi:DNA-binding transcriptional ArsR family regulator